MKYDIIIGIDPDTEKSGVCFLETATRILEVSSLTLPQLIDYLEFVKSKKMNYNEKIVVVVEASWTTTHNHHLAGKHTLASASKTGYNIGRNHQQGIVICEMAKKLGFEVVEQPPLRKCWKGINGKITHKELQNLLYNSGLGMLDKKTSNQEERDAALICFFSSNLPLKYKPTK